MREWQVVTVALFHVNSLLIGIPFEWKEQIIPDIHVYGEEGPGHTFTHKLYIISKSQVQPKVK